MFSITSIVQTAGYFGVFGMIYAETGLLIGMFFPGDSLLFTAGFLASQGYLHIVLLCALTGLAAILGDNTGYWLGRKFGPRVFSKERSLFFNPRNIEYARSYYERYGSKTIILARFIPIVRTVAPTLAGVGHMRYRTFLIFSVLGGILWGIGIPAAGYLLGNTIPNVDHYLLPIIGMIIIVSVAPGLYHFWKERQRS